MQYPTPNRNEALNGGLRLWWLPFRNHIGYPIDLNGYTTKIIVNGGPNWSGESLQFNGSTQELGFINSPYIGPDGPTTISLWAKFSDGSANNRGVAMNYATPGGNGKGWKFDFRPGANARYSVTFGNGTASAQTINGSIYGATWTHLLLTHDGTTGWFYIDAKLQGTATKALACPRSGDVGFNTYVYIASFGGGNYFPGYITDFRITSQYATPSQVADLFSDSNLGREKTLVKRRTFYFGTAAGAPPSSTFDVIGGGCGQFMIGAD